MGTAQGKPGGEFEKTGNAQLAHNDHHAEQKRDGIEIDGFQRFIEAQRPQTNHQACADEHYAGAVDPQPGRAAESHSRIKSKRRQQSLRPSRVKRGSWEFCLFRDRAWRGRVEFSRFRHAKEIKQKS